MGHSNLTHLQANPLAMQGIPKAAIERIGLADALVQELLFCFGCLATVVQEFGPATLIDLMCLQGAVMKGTFIEASVEQSALLKCLGQLPSASTWLTYVDVVEPD